MLFHIPVPLGERDPLVGARLGAGEVVLGDQIAAGPDGLGRVAALEHQPGRRGRVEAHRWELLVYAPVDPPLLDEVEDVWTGIEGADDDLAFFYIVTLGGFDEGRRTADGDHAD